VRINYAHVHNLYGRTQNTYLEQTLMPQQNLDFGTAAPRDGESLFDGFTKIEAMFTEIYTAMDFTGGNVELKNWISGDGDSEGLTISDAGNIGVGTSTVNWNIVVETSAGADTRGLVLANLSDDVNTGVGLYLVANSFGTSSTNRSASVRSRKVSSGQYWMDMGFFTSRASIATEKMTIQAQGHIEVANRMSINGTSTSDITGEGEPDAALDVNGAIAVTDGVSAPVAVSGKSFLYVDNLDGYLKVRHGDNETIRLDHIGPEDVSNVAALSDITNSFSDGQTVRTKGYYTDGDGGGNEYIYNSTGRSGITADGGFYINGPAVDDYFEAKDKSIAYTSRFGANGIADGTSRLQAAIDAVYVGSTSTSVAKKVVIDGQITITSYITIAGKSSILRGDSGEVYLNSAYYDGTIDTQYLIACGLQTKGQAYTADDEFTGRFSMRVRIGPNGRVNRGINFFAFNKMTVENCEFIANEWALPLPSAAYRCAGAINCQVNASWLSTSTGNRSHSVFRNNYIDIQSAAGGGEGISISGGIGCRVENNTVLNQGDDSIAMHQCDQCIAINNNISAPAGAIIDTDGYGNSIIGNTIERVADVNDDYTDAGGLIRTRVESSVQNAPDGLTISGNTLIVPNKIRSAYGIRVLGADSVIISGNMLLAPATTGTCPSSPATADKIVLASDASDADDFYNNGTIKITDGTGAGQERTITDYVGSSREATLSSDLSPSADNTTVYKIDSSITFISVAAGPTDFGAGWSPPNERNTGSDPDAVPLRNVVISNNVCSAESYGTIAVTYFSPATSDDVFGPVHISGNIAGAYSTSAIGSRVVTMRDNATIGGNSTGFSNIGAYHTAELLTTFEWDGADGTWTAGVEQDADRMIVWRPARPGRINRIDYVSDTDLYGGGVGFQGRVYVDDLVTAKVGPSSILNVFTTAGVAASAGTEFESESEIKVTLSRINKALGGQSTNIKAYVYGQYDNGAGENIFDEESSSQSGESSSSSSSSHSAP
jgi:parallel beta-helix repeat protein